MEKKLGKRLVFVCLAIFIILLYVFFPSNLMCRQRIYMYYGTNGLDLHQLKILAFIGMDDVEKIKVHKLPDLKRPSLNEAFKMLYEERMNKPADNDYFYHYPEYFDLPFLEAINFKENYGTIRYGTSGDAEALLNYWKDRAAYNYYFTLSKDNDGYRLFVFRIRDHKPEEFTNADYIQRHSKDILR